MIPGLPENTTALARAATASARSFPRPAPSSPNRSTGMECAQRRSHGSDSSDSGLVELEYSENNAGDVPGGEDEAKEKRFLGAPVALKKGGVAVAVAGHSPLKDNKWQRSSSESSSSSSSATSTAASPEIGHLAEIRSLVEPMIDSGEVDAAVYALGSALKEHAKCRATQRYCNNELFALAERDDPAVVGLIMRSCVLEGMVRGAECCEGDAALQEIACRLLWLLGCEKRNRSAIMSAGGCTLIVRALTRHIAKEDVVAAAFGAIKPLTVDFYGGGENAAVERKDAARAIARAMAAHARNPELQGDGCSVLSNLAVDIQNQKVAIATAEEMDAILCAMSNHPDNKFVQKQACFALKHLAFAPINAKALLEAELPTRTLLERAAKRFPDECRRDVKIALKRIAKVSKSAESSSSSSSLRSNSSARPQQPVSSSSTCSVDSKRASSTPLSADDSRESSSPASSSRRSSSAMRQEVTLPPRPRTSSDAQRLSSPPVVSARYPQSPSPTATSGGLETICEKKVSIASPRHRHRHFKNQRRKRGGASPSLSSYSSPSSATGGTALADELLKNAVRSGQRGEYSSARAQFEIVLKMKFSVYGANAVNSDLVNVLNCIGYVCAVSDDTSGALSHYQRSLAMQRQLLNGAPGDEALASTLGSIAVLYIKVRDLESAENFLKEAMNIKIFIRDSGRASQCATDIAICRELESLGDLRRIGGNPEEADMMYKLAAECYSNSGGLNTVTDQNALREFEVSLADITFKLGVLAGTRGDNIAAKRLTEAALDTKKRVYGPGAQNSDLAMSLCGVAYVDAAAGDVVEATRRYEASLDMQRHILGTGGQLRNENLARTLTSLGMLCIQRGQRSAARSYLEEALDVKRSLLGESEETEEASRELLEMLRCLGDACDDDKDAEIYFEEALQHACLLLYYEEALEHASLKSNSNTRLFDIRIKIAGLLFELGLIFMRQGKFDSARERCEKALEIYLSLWQDKNGNHPVDVPLVYLLNTLGCVCAAMGDYPAAIDKYSISLKLQRNTTKPGIVTNEMAHTQNSLGVIYTKYGAFTVAEKCLLESLYLKRLIFGANARINPSVADTLRNLGEVCMARRKYYEAEAHFEEAFCVYDAVMEDNGKDVRADVSDLYSKMGILAGLRGDILSAQEHLELSLEIKRDLYAQYAANLDLVKVLNSLGYAYAAGGNYDLAIEQYEESLDMLQSIHGIDAECEDIINTTRSLNLLKRIKYTLRCANSYEQN